MTDALLCWYWLTGWFWMLQLSTQLEHNIDSPAIAATGPRTLAPLVGFVRRGQGARASSRHLPPLSCIGGGHLAKLRA